MKRHALFIVFSIFLFPALAPAEWQAKVVDVFDGDTLIVSREGRAEIISLFGIDCPEKEQPFGLEAKGFTSHLVSGKTIRIIPLKRSRYEMCKVYIGDKCLNEELLKAGYAWHYKDSTDEKWAKMEQNAHSEGMGLWSEESPVPPWEFRGVKDKRTLDRAYTIKIPGKHESFSSPRATGARPTSKPRTRRRSKE